MKDKIMGNFNHSPLRKPKLDLVTPLDEDAHVKKDKGCVSCKYYGTDDDGFEYCAYETLVNSGNLEEIPKERTCKSFSPKCEDELRKQLQREAV